MKKYIIIGLCAALFGCSQPGYRMDVELEGATGKMLLEQRQGRNFQAIDTVQIVDGKASFKGEVPYPDVYFLSVEGSPQKAMLFIENTKMKVSGHVDSLRTIRVTGSPVNDEYAGIRKELDKGSEEGMKKYQEYQSAVQSGDKEKSTRLMEEVEALFDAQNNKIVDFVKNNPSSWVTPLFLSQIQQNMEIEELEPLLASLDTTLNVVPALKTIKERGVKLKKVAVGQTAPDFTQNDPDGKPVKLSDIYKGNEYTLIDFWAAWCGPCRMENPNVVAVFNDYKSKGFGVFGVSLDQDRERWLKAIQDDKLTWPQVSDLKYWQNEAAALYAVSSIPSNFLVDKTGKIVARNLREQALRDKFAELLP